MSTFDLRGVHVVVTGGAGLIGRAIVTELLAQDAEVRVLDRGPQPPAAPDVDWRSGSILDEQLLRDTLQGADALVHIAGRAGLDQGTPTEIYATNALGTFLALEVAAQAGIARVAYASSINANGLPLHPHGALPSAFPWNEDEPGDLADAYSLSKAANEQAAAAAVRRHGGQVVGLRYPLVRDIHADGGTVFAAHIRRALREDPRRQAVEGWSYLDVRDAARATVAALRRDIPAGPGILVANPSTYLRLPTQEALSRLLPEVPRRRAFVGREVPLDLSRARELLDTPPREHLEDIDPGLLADLEEAA